MFLAVQCLGMRPGYLPHPHIVQRLPRKVCCQPESEREPLDRQHYAISCWLCWCCITKWAMSWENLFIPYANNKDTDPPVHLSRMISTFVVCCPGSISVVSISEISRLQLASVLEQAGLSLTWSKNPKTCFLVTRFKLYNVEKWLWSVISLLGAQHFTENHFSDMSHVMRKSVFGGPQPRKTKTSLLSYRSWLESWNFGCS